LIFDSVCFTLAASSGKRNVTVWNSSVRVSVFPLDILTMTHQGAACDAASAQFGPTVRRTEINLFLNVTGNVMRKVGNLHDVWKTGIYTFLYTIYIIPLIHCTSRLVAL